MRRRQRRDPPTGWRRALFRLPIICYRLGVGWVLGTRFVLINHVGRRTGHLHTAVVEVVDHDPDADTCTVASGFGPSADWYRNLLATPDVTIQIGRRTIPVTARALSDDEGADAMAGYAAAHPRTARRIARFMGFEVDGTERDYREVGRAVPFVRFAPRPVVT
jgi:deazaflavin-dependent oxidoreductase (nitroreductase family)